MSVPNDKCCVHYTAGDEEEEELDEATRQFNFWTHQVHIFFVRKFFPSAQHYALIQQCLADKYSSAAVELTVDCVTGADSAISQALHTAQGTQPDDNMHTIDITEATDSVKTDS